MKEGAAAVQETMSDHVGPEQEGQFVHLTGESTTDEVLEDREFGISANAIRLTRTVEMYQWQERESRETRKKLGGRTETVTTYSYEKTWSEHAIDAADFHDRGHENPSQWPYESLAQEATDIRVGAYRLPESLISKIQGSEELPVELAKLPKNLRNVVRAYGANGFYWPRSGSVAPEAATETGPSANLEAESGNAAPAVQTGSGEPQIGDVRVSFAVTRPTAVSIMSQQQEQTFTPFKTSNGRELHMLAMGAVPASEMIAAAERENTLWTWGLRAIGFVMMGFGLGMIFKPMSVVADVVPFAGDLVEMGTGFVGFGIAAACSLLTISLAWLFYRPLIGAPLLVAAIGVVVVLVKMLLKARSARAAQQTEVVSKQPVQADNEPAEEKLGA